ncbi:MAG: ACT domain-containing protein [Propionibacteriaceae bacterium]|nr:ACT domain-containing protein [Propionibacteriaceae bacterium]
MTDRGLVDLTELLRGLEPVRRPGEYVMVSTNSEVSLPCQASVVEDEGTSLVLERHTADAFRLDYPAVFAWITLTVHSSLAAVGLTSAVAAALAAHGIPCNVLAGFHHDHLLVPADRVEEALAALAELSASAA